MTDYFGEVAKQGLGYLLFIGSLSINIYLYKEKSKVDKVVIDLADKRLNDVKEMKDSYFNQIESVKTNFLQSVTKSQDLAQATLSIAQNLQSILNSREK